MASTHTGPEGRRRGVGKKRGGIERVGGRERGGDGSVMGTNGSEWPICVA